MQVIEISLTRTCTCAFSLYSIEEKICYGFIERLGAAHLIYTSVPHVRVLLPLQ